MRMEPFVLSSRRSAQRESRDAAIMGFPGNDRLGSVVGKTKTPPSGRGGVLGPAATPGEDAAAVQPTNSLTRWRFRGQLPEFCGALSGGGSRKHLLGVGARHERQRGVVEVGEILRLPLQEAGHRGEIDAGIDVDARAVRLYR